MFCRAIAALILSTTFATSPSWGASAYAVGTVGPRSWGAGGFDHANFSDAQRHALATCSRGGPGCGIVALFSDACFALAVQLGAPGYSGAVRPTLAEARRAAMMRCVARGLSCSLKASYCDFSRPTAEGATEFSFPGEATRWPERSPYSRPACGRGAGICEYK